MFYAIDYYEFQTGITTGYYSTQAHLTLFHAYNSIPEIINSAVINSTQIILFNSIIIELYLKLARIYDIYRFAVIREIIDLFLHYRHYWHQITLSNVDLTTSFPY